jgi:hypothetical protein
LLCDQGPVCFLPIFNRGWGGLGKGNFHLDTLVVARNLDSARRRRSSFLSAAKSRPSQIPCVLATFQPQIYFHPIPRTGVPKLSPLGPNFVTNRPGKIDLKVFKSQISP